MNSVVASNQFKKVDINGPIGRIMPKVRITTAGINQNLKRLQFTPKNFSHSVAEYIWNGFDAKASEVKLDYEFTENGTIRELVIQEHENNSCQGIN